MALVSFSKFTFGAEYIIYHQGDKRVFCDGKSHPKPNYKVYRRGFHRCKTCGCLLGWKMNFDVYNLPISNSNIKLGDVKL